MRGLLLLLACLMTLIHGHGQEGDAECGGMLTSPRGVLQTPHFPHKFPVPVRCRWVIDTSQLVADHRSSIVVYFTQLFVSAGLIFTEFDYYEHDSTFQLGGREIHRVTEQNVTSVGWVSTRRHYLVVDFTLDRLEGNHLRVLDGLLDVYGFNITYELADPDELSANHACSVLSCSMSGHCYVSFDFKEYSCECFRGFSGADCSIGPLCQTTTNLCENGAICRQVGATASSCLCSGGFTGPKCEVRLLDQDCTEVGSCTSQCPEDATGEPCACSHKGGPITNDRARYEGTLRLSNVSAVRQCLESTVCTLKPSLTKQISKYLRNSNLSVMDDLRVLDVGFSGEVRFHFWGGRSEGSRVRESLNRLVQRGRLGNVTLVATHLAITQEPNLHLAVRQGDEFILSCIAQGSSHLAFRWFKDGVHINTLRARRRMWSRQLPLDSAEQYTALLVVEAADPLDQGSYTCQVTDWGFQQCQTLQLEVLRAPRVRVDPMSITVEKGENVTIKCTSPNELQFNGKFGYSWTKNNALFKMTPGEEFWEDLYPGGSLLRIYNVQKSATYTCHVHGSVRSVSRGMRLEVLNQSVAPWCASDETGVGGIRWERAGPGVMARVECPSHYQGVATRLCLLVDGHQVLWQTPDFSDCVSDKITAVSNNFHRVTLGFGNTSALDAVFGILTSLRDRGVIYPGEGEPAIALLNRVVSYLNDTAAWRQLTNATNYFYSAVNTLLQHRNSVINHQRVEELQQVVSWWSGLWGGQGGTGSAHLAFDSLVVDLFRYEEPASRHGLSVRIPRPTLSYPPWFSSGVNLHLKSDSVSKNLSSNVAVIVYNGLSDFLPQRYSQTLENGSEVQYEVASELVTVVSRGPLLVASSVELCHASRPGWDLRCAVTSTPSSWWNLTACSATSLTGNHTRCQCPRLGTYAAMLVRVVQARDYIPRNASPRIVLVGCACCLVQSLLTLSLLSLRWWRHRTCLVFLKLQCCASTVAAMLVFLYACSRSLPEKSYPSISTSLQAIILLGMSSHLSKLLLVYTEVVYLPDVKHLKQTIISILSGVPLLVVLCNHLAQVSTASRAPSWWLVRRTMVFYSCLSCGLLLVVLFVFLHIHVSRRLRTLTITKNSDTKKAVQRRLGLLNRAGVVFTATVVMAASSVLYINYPTIRCQYLFSISCALLGFLLLACYVLHCESPLHLHVLRTFKLQHADNPAFCSESDSTPLSIFTKQEAEVECEGAPPRTVNGGQTLLRNGRPESLRGSPVEGSERAREAESCVDSHRIKEGATMNELFTVSEKVSRDEQQQQQVELEVYPGCVRTTPQDPMDSTTMTTRVCVITSVVVDTPSVVVCSVDVEPCSVLNKSIVSCGEALPVKQVKDVQEAGEASQAITKEESGDIDPETEGDVMDRICHDLNYLLGGVKNVADNQEIPNILIQNTSL